MNRACFILKLKKDKISEYLQAHQVWDEMLRTHTSCGIHNYSLFLGQGGIVVGYLESDGDPKDALKLVSQTDISKEWEKKMDEYFIKTQGKRGICWLEEYFHMD